MEKFTKKQRLRNKLFNWYAKKGAYYLKYFILLPGTGCRFSPTCSEYARQSYGKYNPIKATYKSIWRILRCNPYSKGGIDYP